MSSAEHHHAQGILHFNAGNFEEAAKCLRAALREEDSSERWSDWASAEFCLSRHEEAEAGFEIALELDPSNHQAALNLATLLVSESRPHEAMRLLDSVRASGNAEQIASADQLLIKARQSNAQDGTAQADLETYLRGFVAQNPNEISYFETHLRRYLKTLSLLPNAKPGMRVLELGAAFHHLTPALLRHKGFAEVRCNDLWRGEPHTTRRISSTTGDESFSFLVDNFDVQLSPWPYEDESFDAVLCCEMLEHFHSDPMGVVAEINRILKPNDLLLLTTPNLASCHAVEYALRGESPYVYGKFEPEGASTDRHNREYTAGEVERLARSAGFEVELLRTQNSWWNSSREVLRLLAANGHPIARRGDNIFLLARKASPVRDRFPEEFYLTLGTQAERRTQQSATALAPTQIAAQPRNILVIHELVPQIDRSGSDLRLYDILSELRRQRHNVTLLARDARDSERYIPAIEQLGVKVIAEDPDRLHHLGTDAKTPWSFEDLLRKGNFHAAILFHWFWSSISVPEQYLDDIRRHSPSTRIAILTDDRHGERERRAAALSGHLSDLERGNNFESRELEMYRRADLLLYITEADRRRFAEFLPDLPMEHLPIVASEAPAAPDFARREGILFLGNFDNLANRDALDWMLREIWPLVCKKSPSLKLYVAGHGAPEDIAQQYSNVVCLGHVPNLSELFAKRRTFAAPIRFGTGINTKNLQAMSHGLPVVTTSIGAEGLQARNNEHLFIADTPEDFANRLIELSANEAVWSRLSTLGREFLRAQFSRENLTAQVRKIVCTLNSLAPKSAKSDSLPSYRLIEQNLPAVLTAQSARYRTVLRTLGYWQLGRDHFAKHDYSEALAQFRHTFTALRGALPSTTFHHRLLADMSAAGRAIQDHNSATRCEKESHRLVSLDRPAVASIFSSGLKNKNRASDAPLDLSVVLPTFNRKETLRLCLSALAFQTLPADRWEVIVVDDGSTDGTEDLCRTIALPYPLKFLRQQNAGAGSARRAGVEFARGEYILLINDDTIASSTLLSEHLFVHRQHPKEKWAVLGNFVPSELCADRALSLWINTSPFFFPHQTLKPGQLCDASHFVTCNLSVRRDAIRNAGNFDPRFRVAEDTELGARLIKQGFRVRYHPEAAATHEHGRFSTADLLSRADNYGRADHLLFELHPELLASGTSPFGKLQPSDLQRIAALLDAKREAVTAALSALRALDDFDLRPLWLSNGGSPGSIEAVLQQLNTIVPLVYWHHLLETFFSNHRLSPETHSPAESKSLLAAQLP